MPGTAILCFSEWISGRKATHISFANACYIHYISHRLISQTNFVKNMDLVSSHNIIFFILVLPFPVRPKYRSKHPILIHPQPVFLPNCERSGLTPNANIIVNRL